MDGFGALLAPPPPPAGPPRRAPPADGPPRPPGEIEKDSGLKCVPERETLYKSLPPRIGLEFLGENDLLPTAPRGPAPPPPPPPTRLLGGAGNSEVGN